MVVADHLPLLVIAALHELISPSNMFGSGKTIVASVPVTSSSVAAARRVEGEDHRAPTGPDSNWAIALTWLGTVTANSSPAFGPDPITRGLPAFEPIAATEAIGPKVWTSAVR